MKRNKIVAGFLGAVLAVSPAFAEDWEDEAYEDVDFSEDVVEDSGFADDGGLTEEAPVDVKDLARFNPVLNIRNIKKECPEASITVTTPKGVATEAITHKAYPHGSTIVATEGVTFRLLFAPSSYVVVKGPAKIVLDVTENNRKAIIDVAYGDVNIRVAQTVKKEQVFLKTPVGTFESLVGIFNLRIDAEDGVDGGNVTFRTATGYARFAGSSYGALALLDNNAFNVNMKAAQGQRMADTTNEVVTGRVGVFNLAVKDHAGSADKEVQLLPAAGLRISREKPAGSENWVVTVMGLHSDGSIRSYFSYVENREDPLYWIPEQIVAEEDASAEDEDGEEDETEQDNEEEAEEDEFSDDYPEELGDFDDELL
ncbi:MAG: hypothetical protein Q4C03_01780 [bacterium]|nr:hypothetical protein [bacterium]